MNLISAFSAMEFPQESITLDIPSVNKVCGEANQIVVYGYECCKYGLVLECFNKVLIGNENIKVKKCFDCELGETLEGRNMSIIEEDKMWKIALVDLVFENYLRIHEEKKIIPLIFCVDIEGNEYKYSIDSITEKSVHRLTDSELRRCYKLMYDLGDNSTAKALSIIAIASFKFVKLTKTKKTESEYSFEPVKTFSKEEWRKAMEIRRKGKPPTSTEWIEILMSLVATVTKTVDRYKQDTTKLVAALSKEISSKSEADSKKDT